MKTSTRIIATLAYAWSAVALGAAVGGDISKVNGSIRIEDGQVAGDVSSVNGSVSIGRGATADAIVEGPLHFEREIDLYVAPGVTLPPIQGIAPKRHTLQ